MYIVFFFIFSNPHFIQWCSPCLLLPLVCVWVCVCVTLWADVFSSLGLETSSESQWGKKSRCRGTGGVTTETSWCWQTNLCLSLFSSLVLIFQFAYLVFFFFFLLRINYLWFYLCFFFSHYKCLYHISLIALILTFSHCLLQGERCSFSVQMWFYFLCGLRSDLWAVLPAGSAKELLGQVLSETLQLLVQRYARARPSYERHLQIRYLIIHRAGCSHAVIEFAPIFLNSLYLSQVTQLQFQSWWFPDKYCFPFNIPLLTYVKPLINMRIIIQSV